MSRGDKSFLTFNAPEIREEEMLEVMRCLESGWIGTGGRVATFVDDFKTYKGVQHAAALNSCTAALHLSLLTAGIGPGDEVITTPMTFCATINTIIHCGATPVLADIDPVTMNIDPEQIKEKITKRTKAILPVHFAGRPCEMDEITAISRQHGLQVIEDCAHALETEYHGQKAGTIGDFGCFSFYVTKNITTGEGGMVLAKSEENIRNIQILGLHGLSKDAWKRFSDSGFQHYSVLAPGYKYNMIDLQAALGIHQLARVEESWLKRRHIWNRYNQELSDLPVILPAPTAPDTRHAYHLYTVLIDKTQCGLERDEFLEHMHAHGIGMGVHYLSLPEHPFYQNAYGWRPEDYPHAELIGQQTVSLPLSPKLTDADIDRVIESARQILRA
ncbi:DegT/DnrJ/EryC1/StrS family aminotransferase [Paenibacillus filicis]|uniref:DegT/DnrJ/EryC1/StrS family aminotransferase n=1 Tax=Paenibacillus filicis TaxID=669464 RepID=A0ABU9DE26_9BACL